MLFDLEKTGAVACSTALDSNTHVILIPSNLFLERFFFGRPEGAPSSCNTYPCCFSLALPYSSLLPWNDDANHSPRRKRTEKKKGAEAGKINRKRWQRVHAEGR